MIIRFKIDYDTVWGENLYVCGSIPELGAWNENNALLLNCHESAKWTGQVDIKEVNSFEYYYFLKKENSIWRKEWGIPRSVSSEKSEKLYLTDAWHDKPAQEFLYTSAFSNSFFAHEQKAIKKQFSQSLILNILCPYVEKNQELILCGDSDVLGNWNINAALRAVYSGNGFWQIEINALTVQCPLEFKLAICDKISKDIIYWENGNNRILGSLSDNPDESITRIIELAFCHNSVLWKGVGVAIPVFSLRSENSFGTGEFSDLKKMIDWVEKTGQKIIQVLPVNDTTISHTWVDSYPYNAISIYALHPLYLGLSEFPLKNKELFVSYQQRAQRLNMLPSLNYEEVMKLKNSYFKDLFDETGQEIILTDNFKAFYKTNEDWLFPYACFCLLRDKFGTAAYSEWNEFGHYDKNRLERLIREDALAKQVIETCYFIQYLLHVQFSDVREYAHGKGIVLKGDIPIGISRNSVEAWVDPQLFNMDTQTGAPPDDFSMTGQNWGFPTYNWDEMEKDGYQWWIRRFRKMTDYFDAYRIDHILGFFRIWEIPLHSTQGLLGYFSPARPLTIDEIERAGLVFDEQRMTVPFIHKDYLDKMFGDFTPKIIDLYLDSTGNQQFCLKDFCDTQQKIKHLFVERNDDENIFIRDGLYSLCNEVLFVRDKKESDCFHPRISAQSSHSFSYLDEVSQVAFSWLYDDFYYCRHNEFWKQQALKKLPALISSTRMLVCGEDLGMIPLCVPEVMNELQILSLEIQRMPKIFGVVFEDLNKIPYHSVCTTSTHDMSTIRGWWKENRELIQHYYNEILGIQGLAPDDCIPELCRKIISLHLKSAAMLVIIPLQDWLSVDANLRVENPDEERINIPAISQHYWKYRMHLTLEKLLEAKDINDYILLAAKRF